jgi:hypothetical protein
MHIGLNVKVPLLLSHVNETRMFSTNFERIMKSEISEKSVQWEPSCSFRTDRRDEDKICFLQICELSCDGIHLN